MDPEKPNTAAELKARLQITCQNCSLTELCLPRGLSTEDMERIGRIVNRRRTLHRGDHLFHKGEAFRGIIAVKAGTAKTVSYDEQGNEYVTGLMLPGELLGFDGLAANRHVYSAIALETLSFCELPADQLEPLCQEVPSLLRELFRHASARMGEESEQIILMKRPADERVAAFLLGLSSRLEARGFSPVEFRLSLTRQEIGNYLGLALETVSRTFRLLQDQGLISVKHKSIRILNRAGLEALRA